MTTESRIECLKETIVSEEFLTASKSNSTIPYWVFDYPPKDELLIRDTIRRIEEKLSARSIRYLEIDLYELCLEIIERELSFQSVMSLEAKRGSNNLLKSLRQALPPSDITKYISEKMSEIASVDLLLLTGVGNAYPVLRSQVMLDNLAAITGNVPLVMFYPGKYDGHSFRLFNLFDDGSYYRAAQLIPEDKGVRF